MATLWTSASIEETIYKLRSGQDHIDMSAFYERKIDLKASNILFELTLEEDDEFEKCSDDIEYFVENYCKFLTDKGQQTVDLRDFQRNILTDVGSEIWLEDLDMFGPKVQNYILMASRQTGKCLFNTSINIKDNKTNEIKKINIEQLYIKSSPKTTLSKIKSCLYSFYSYLS
jgi:hypothetical protein